MSRKAVFGPAVARGFSKAWLIGGYVFLYLPIFTLVLLSFNASPMLTNWDGW